MTRLAPYLLIALKKNDASTFITRCKVVSSVIEFNRGDDISCYCASVWAPDLTRYRSTHLP